MRDRGSIISEMEMELKSGLMDPSMMASGVRTKPTVKANLSMQMVMFTKANGLMTKLMEKELTHMPTVPTTMETGSTISNMDLEWNHGQTVPSTKVTMSMERRKGKASSLLLMEVSMKESSNKMRYVVMVSTRGQMVNNMKASGVTIKCMEKVPLFGKTRRSTRVLS